MVTIVPNIIPAIILGFLVGFGWTFGARLATGVLSLFTKG